MRYVINTVLLLALAAALWCWFDQTNGPVSDVASAVKLDARVPDIVREAFEARKRDRQALISGRSGPSDCFVWGPCNARQIAAAQKTLRRSGLTEPAHIVDRFLPERWIVYLGPYDNDVAVKAFVKQFRQQGYRHVRPILRGGLSFGVEVQAFETREQALGWIQSDKSPDVQGLRVTNLRGELTDQVDLLLQGITEDKRPKLEAAQKRWKGTSVRACSDMP